MSAQEDAEMGPDPPKGEKPDARRMSLGSLMGKGLVTGMKGFWEHKPGPNKPGSRKLAPVSQSQDRGLLFKMTTDSQDCEASLARRSCQDTSLTASSPTQTSPASPKQKSPQSAIKKMWGKVTGRSSKTPPPVPRQSSKSPSSTPPLSTSASAEPSKSLDSDARLAVAVAVAAYDEQEAGGALRSPLTSISERRASSAQISNQEYEWDEAEDDPVSSTAMPADTSHRASMSDHGNMQSETNSLLPSAAHSQRNSSAGTAGAALWPALIADDATCSAHGLGNSRAVSAGGCSSHSTAGSESYQAAVDLSAASLQQNTAAAHLDLTAADSYVGSDSAARGDNEWPDEMMEDTEASYTLESAACDTAQLLSDNTPQFKDLAEDSSVVSVQQVQSQEEDELVETTPCGGVVRGSGSPQCLSSASSPRTDVHGLVQQASSTGTGDADDLCAVPVASESSNPANSRSALDAVLALEVSQEEPQATAARPAAPADPSAEAAGGTETLMEDERPTAGTEMVETTETVQVDVYEDDAEELSAATAAEQPLQPQTLSTAEDVTACPVEEQHGNLTDGVCETNEAPSGSDAPLVLLPEEPQPAATPAIDTTGKGAEDQLTASLESNPVSAESSAAAVTAPAQDTAQPEDAVCATSPAPSVGSAAGDLEAMDVDEPVEPPVPEEVPEACLDSDEVMALQPSGAAESSPAAQPSATLGAVSSSSSSPLGSARNSASQVSVPAAETAFTDSLPQPDLAWTGAEAAEVAASTPEPVNMVPAALQIPEIESSEGFLQAGADAMDADDVWTPSLQPATTQSPVLPTEPEQQGPEGAVDTCSSRPSRDGVETTTTDSPVADRPALTMVSSPLVATVEPQDFSPSPSTSPAAAPAAHHPASGQGAIAAAAASAAQPQTGCIQPSASMSLLAADLMAALQLGEEPVFPADSQSAQQAAQWLGLSSDAAAAPGTTGSATSQPVLAAAAQWAGLGGPSDSETPESTTATQQALAGAEWAGLLPSIGGAASGSPELAVSAQAGSAASPAVFGIQSMVSGEGEEDPVEDVHMAAHGLLPMDIDTPVRVQGTALGGLDDLLTHMPPLETTPSPMASPHASPRMPIQVTRESIPLFVRGSYAVTDSVSLERQSLASIEPFGRPSAHTTLNSSITGLGGTGARTAGVKASVMTLDTLTEEETLADDPAAKPTSGVVHSTAPGGRHVASIAEEQLDMPSDLPATSAHADAGVAVAATPVSHKAAASAGKAGGATDAHQTASKNLKTPNTANRRLVGPAASTATKTPGHHPAPPSNPRSASGGGRGVATAGAAGAGRHAQQTPGAGAGARHGAGHTASHTSGRTAGSSGGGGDHSTPKPRAALRNTAGAGHGTKNAAPVATTPAAAPAVAGAVSPAGPAVAGPPPMPTSWATPLAKMQQLPMNFALNAPLMDTSPFAGLDDNLDTTNIMQEAARMAQALGGGVQPTLATIAGSPMTPAVLDLSQGLGGHGLQTSITPNVPSAGSFGGFAHIATGAPPSYMMTTPTGALCSQVMMPDLSPAAAGLLQSQNKILMEQLLAAEQRAKEAEQQVEQLKDQIQTLSFGDMMQQAGAGDMEREARLCAEEQLQAAQHEVAKLHKTIVGQKAEMQVKDAALQESQATVRQLLEDLKSKDRELEARQQAEAAALKKVVELEAANKHMREQGQKQLDQAHADINMLKQKVAAAESGNMRLRQERDEAKAVMDKASEKLVAEQVKLKQAAAEYEKRAGALETTMTRYKAERDQLRNERPVMMKQMQDALQASANHEAKIAKLKHDNAELMRMAEDLMGQLERSQKTAAAAKTK